MVGYDGFHAPIRQGEKAQTMSYTVVIRQPEPDETVFSGDLLPLRIDMDSGSPPEMIVALNLLAKHIATMRPCDKLTFHSIEFSCTSCRTKENAKW